MASYKLALASIKGCSSRGLVASYKQALKSIKGCTSRRLVASYKLALRSIKRYTSKGHVALWIIKDVLTGNGSQLQAGSRESK